MTGGPITLEQLLLATRVLIQRNPQGLGWRYDEDMLKDAYEFVRTANEVLLNPPQDYRKAQLEFCAKYGYDRPEKFEFVPYSELARKIVGQRRTKQEEDNRLKQFIIAHQELRMLTGQIRRYGIRKDCIAGLAAEEKKQHKERVRQTNQRNAGKKKK
jgi:hypothetical protein